MMDIDQTQRRDIDDIQNDKVSLTIDDYNLLSSPFSKDLYDYMVDGYNWIKFNDKMIKYNLVENDKLVFHIDKIDELIEKYITNIKIEFDIDTGNNNFIFDGVNLIHNDIIKNKSFHIFMSNRHMNFDCGVFNYNDLDFIVNGKGFDIELLFNGNKSNSMLSLKNVKIVFTFYEKLQDEKDTIYNRIEKEILDKIYPIGSIYMNINSTPPDIIIGGEWQRIKDTFLLSAGDVYDGGSSGGEATHTLTSAESGLKAHSHNFTQPSVELGSHYHGTSTSGEYFVTSEKNSASNTRVTYSSNGNRYVDGMSDNTTPFHHRGYTDTRNLGTKTATGGAVQEKTGENATSAHNNMPPYLTVYMWQRIG